MRWTVRLFISYKNVLHTFKTYNNVLSYAEMEMKYEK